MTESKLGRGVEALFDNVEIGALNEDVSGDLNVRMISIDKLKSGRYQPRQDMDDQSLEELAESIRSFGMIQPIVAQQIPEDDRYEIIAGERRWRAAQLAGYTEVPVSVREFENEDKLAVSLIENMQRQDLNPVEEARGLKRLVEEFKMTHQQIADSIGKSRASISNQMRLLHLAEPALDRLFNGEIDTGHAKVLLSLPQADDQARASEIIVDKELSVRQTEELVRRWQSSPPKKKTSSPVQDKDIVNLEVELSDKIGAPVSIKDNGGKGYIRIRYHSLDELDGILRHIT